MGSLKFISGIVAAGVAVSAVGRCLESDNAADAVINAAVAGVSSTIAYKFLKDEIKDEVVKQTGSCNDTKMLT